MIITIITIETTMATTTTMIIINKSKTLTNIMTIIHGDKDIYICINDLNIVKVSGFKPY